MKYNTFLFDWDGTLLDSQPAWDKVFQEILSFGGIKLTKTQQTRCISHWVNMRKYVEMSDEKWFSIRNHGQEIAPKYIKNIPLMPGVIDMLKVLHKNNCQTALITRSFRKVVGPMLESHGLIGGFDAVICYEDVKQHKPNPEPLYKAMEELGSNPEETIMIGDGLADIEAAHNAEVDSCLFWREERAQYYSKKELLALKPTYVANSWDEFTSLVE